MPDLVSFSWPPTTKQGGKSRRVIFAAPHVGSSLIGGGFVWVYSPPSRKSLVLARLAKAEWEAEMGLTGNPGCDNLILWFNGTEGKTTTAPTTEGIY